MASHSQDQLLEQKGSLELVQSLEPVLYRPEGPEVGIIRNFCPLNDIYKYMPQILECPEKFSITEFDSNRDIVKNPVLGYRVTKGKEKINFVEQGVYNIEFYVMGTPLMGYSQFMLVVPEKDLDKSKIRGKVVPALLTLDKNKNYESIEFKKHSTMPLDIDKEVIDILIKSPEYEFTSDDKERLMGLAKNVEDKYWLAGSFINKKGKFLGIF